MVNKSRLCAPGVLLAPSASVSRVPVGRRCLQSCRFFSISGFIKYLGDIMKIFISNCKGRCFFWQMLCFSGPVRGTKSNAERCHLGGSIPHPYLYQRLSYPQTSWVWSQEHTNSTWGAVLALRHTHSLSKHSRRGTVVFLMPPSKHMLRGLVTQHESWDVQTHLCQPLTRKCLWSTPTKHLQPVWLLCCLWINTCSPGRAALLFKLMDLQIVEYENDPW